MSESHEYHATKSKSPGDRQKYKNNHKKQENQNLLVITKSGIKQKKKTKLKDAKKKKASDDRYSISNMVSTMETKRITSIQIGQTKGAEKVVISVPEVRVLGPDFYANEDVSSNYVI